MSVKRKAAGSVLLLAVLGAIVGMAVTFSAFVSTTSNEGNDFAAGTVVLSDNDAEAKLFELAEMAPGSSRTRCLNVKYTGSLESNVHLYGATVAQSADKNLAEHLDIKVTRGSGAGDLDCTGFVADASNSVLYDGALDRFAADHSAYDSGIVDPDQAWSTDEEVSYQVTVTLRDENAAQGKQANATLSFEARNNAPAA